MFFNRLCFKQMSYFGQSEEEKREMILLKKRQDVLRMVKFNRNLEAIFVTFDLNCHLIDLIYYLVFDSFLPIET